MNGFSLPVATSYCSFSRIYIWDMYFGFLLFFNPCIYCILFHLETELHYHPPPKNFGENERGNMNCQVPLTPSCIFCPSNIKRYIICRPGALSSFPIYENPSMKISLCSWKCELNLSCVTEEQRQLN